MTLVVGVFTIHLIRNLVVGFQPLECLSVNEFHPLLSSILLRIGIQGCPGQKVNLNLMGAGNTGKGEVGLGDWDRCRKERV